MTASFIPSLVYLTVACVFEAQCVQSIDSKLCKPDPEVFMNASQLIRSKGYPCEEYTVQTPDGFLLGMQRIPHGRHGRGNSVLARPVVFLQHGLLCASTNWLTNLANESFGYLLADAGFDVWMGNSRGNTYSRRHVKYKSTDKEFWDWSWDEMAHYDLPTMVDFVVNHTRQKQLYYVGHSQGTLTAFAHASQNPQFAKQVKLFFALAPVATVAHIKGPLKILSHFTWEFEDLLKWLGVHEFLPDSYLIKLLGKTVCDADTRIFCEDILFIICGFDKQQLNITRLPVYLNHVPAGTSTRDIVHFAQMVKAGKFQMYDFGSKKKNLDHYGQTHPPVYNLTKVNVPVVVMSGGKDWLADPQDVTYLLSQLPNVVKHLQIAQWDHLDFVWGMDAPRLIYHPIIEMMKKDIAGLPL